MREEIFDLAEGIGRIRWSDDSAEVRRQYPRQCAIFREPRVAIPGFLRASRNVSFVAEVSFEAGQVDEIVLHPSLDGEPEDWTAERRRAISRLAEWLDLDLGASFRPQTKGNARVEFEEDWDGFTLWLRPTEDSP